MAMPIEDGDSGIAKVIDIFRNVPSEAREDSAVDEVVVRAEEIIQKILP